MYFLFFFELLSATVERQKGKKENKRLLKTNTKITIKTQNVKKFNKTVKNNSKKAIDH